MDQDEIKLHGEAYARAVAIFDEIAPELPGGLSREVFLDLVMQATVCRWTMLPRSLAERDNKIRAVISTLVDLAPGSAFEGKLAVQMLVNHKVIVDCQSAPSITISSRITGKRTRSTLIRRWRFT